MDGQVPSAKEKGVLMPRSVSFRHHRTHLYEAKVSRWFTNEGGRKELSPDVAYINASSHQEARRKLKERPDIWNVYKVHKMNLGVEEEVI